MRSDFELLDGWRAGDRVAGNELVQRYWTSISRFVTSKLGDDSADLIAQTFLACVEARDRIAGDNVRAYLFAVARRRIADQFRTRSRALESVAAESLPSLADLRTGVVTELDRQQRGELLRRALVRIPLDDQIALELAYFEQLSTTELAEVLDVAEPTVRSRLSRARDKLRERLEELADSPELARIAESQLDPR